jgi:protein arginine kinase activator
MLCSLCKAKDATVHLTQIAGDKLQKVDLCEECAKQKGVNDPAGFSLADLLLGLGASQEMEQRSGNADLQCPACGFTHADFKKAGRLGCPQCYDTFAKGLEDMLKTMHKGVHHIGKAPQSRRLAKDLNDRLGSLQKKLKQAVDEENFEQAAAIRDEIKQTRDQLGSLVSK